jgi:hypothetical protein
MEFATGLTCNYEIEIHFNMAWRVVAHINNPGYNRDRGPVIVPTFRAHVEF